MPTVTCNGTPVQVVFAGLTYAGLFQINVVMPNPVASGDVPVVAQAGSELVAEHRGDRGSVTGIII
jgi:uncharacterized protein (TIGR03437 family)